MTATANNAAAETRTITPNEDHASNVDALSDCGSESLHSDGCSTSDSTVGTSTSGAISVEHSAKATEIKSQKEEEDESDDEPFVYPETEEEKAKVLFSWSIFPGNFFRLTPCCLVHRRWNHRSLLW